jgi:hypothetical protein
VIKTHSKQGYTLRLAAFGLALLLIPTGLRAQGALAADAFPKDSLSAPPDWLPADFAPDYTNVPLHRNISDEFEQYAGRKGALLHSAIKPFRYDDLAPAVREDSLYGSLEALGGRNFVERAWNYLAYGHMFSLEQEGLRLYADLLVDLSLGYDLQEEEELYTNTRGIIVKGHIGRKFSFETTFRENQATPPRYLVEFVRDYGVMPGQGRVRRFKQAGLDYANATGYISYSPSRYVNFQFGHGANFIGDGYRSMLLSDNAFFYPHFKINTKVWRFQYVNLFAQFSDLTEPSNFITGFRRKFGSFHYLSYAATDWLQVGFFEGIIWQGSDSGRVRGFDANYLNPVIFYRPVEFGLGSPDNAMMGLNIKVQPTDGLSFYGQFLLDDLDIARSREGEGFYRNKMAWQAGLKWLAPFDLENLTLRAEYNRARPFTYAHKDPTQNYVHYNQSLAHPLGANFDEALGIIYYRHKRVYGEAKLTYARFGADTLGSHNGQDIFISDFDIPNFPDVYGQSTLQGLRTEVLGASVRAGYLFNPVARLAAEISVDYRRLTNANGRQDNTTWIQFGVRSSLFNRYYDF